MACFFQGEGGFFGGFLGREFSGESRREILGFLFAKLSSDFCDGAGRERGA